jgi:hypothetical protein
MYEKDRYRRRDEGNSIMRRIQGRKWEKME